MRRCDGGAGARCPRLCEADYRARPLRPEESDSGPGPCGLSTPPESKRGIPKGLPFGAGSGVRNPSRVQGGSPGRRGPGGARAGGHELRCPSAA